jgi:hypothetical protein
VLVSCSKGILNGTLETVDQLLHRVLPPEARGRLAFMSGPSFAKEVRGAGAGAWAAVGALDEALHEALHGGLSPPMRIGGLHGLARPAWATQQWHNTTWVRARPQPGPRPAPPRLTLRRRWRRACPRWSQSRRATRRWQRRCRCAARRGRRMRAGGGACRRMRALLLLSCPLLYRVTPRRARPRAAPAGAAERAILPELPHDRRDGCAPGSAPQPGRARMLVAVWGMQRSPCATPTFDTHPPCRHRARRRAQERARDRVRHQRRA